METKKSNMVIVCLLVVIVLLCGVIIYLLLNQGSKDNSATNNNKAEEKIEEKVENKEKENNYDLTVLSDVEKFMKQDNDSDAIVMNASELEKYYKAPEQEAGCSHGANGYKYNDYDVVIISEGCVSQTEIYVYKDSKELLHIKEVYGTVIKDDEPLDYSPLFKDGKLYYFVDHNKESYMTFESIDFRNDLKVEEIAEFNLKHGELE